MKRKRLKALIAEIEANPERHFQSDWIVGMMFMSRTFNNELGIYVPERVKEYKGQVINCETKGCIAGLASLRYAPVGTQFWKDRILLPDHTITEYATYGSEVLGLTEREASYLFAAGRSWNEIVAFSDMNKEARNVIMGVYLG